jgi:hypothetical protein
MPKILAREVGFDVTQYFDLPAEDAEDIVKIVDGYVYDQAQHTHCCELTPSYWLRYVYRTIHFRDDLYDYSPEAEDRRNELYEKYGEPGDDMYVHVRDIERRSDTVAIGEYEYATDDEQAASEFMLDDYESAWESACDHAAGNPHFA